MQNPRGKKNNPITLAEKGSPFRILAYMLHIMVIQGLQYYSTIILL